MTAHRTVVLECDGCGATSPTETLCVSDLIHLEQPIISVSDARQVARAKGWRHTALGKDLCPLCQTTPPTPVKRHLHTPHSLFHIRLHRNT
jgi:hypothetical protein